MQQLDFQIIQFGKPLRSYCPGEGVLLGWRLGMNAFDGPEVMAAGQAIPAPADFGTVFTFATV